MAGNQRQGVAFIRVNGLELETLSGCTFTPAGDSRETVKGSRVYGFKATPREASLECKIPGGNGIGLDEVIGWTDITVEFRADTGESWMMPNAWQTDDPQNSDGEITIKVAAKTSKRIA
ncbi:phage tail tube protein [Citrobacter portucalensis]|uniref:phage tail tube protein n=1 Tax=Citrobacter portucalensis TaxID=1639133 RepID=UPI00226B8323|nr:phage tail tube protein [Citrobacter portucalensis]MCX9038882.1 phage tail tube protein [Citrobacter portucalensis]